MLAKIGVRAEIRRPYVLFQYEMERDWVKLIWVPVFLQKVAMIVNC